MNAFDNQTPTQPKERIEFVDILRGFALIGVLLMNMHAYSGYSFDLTQITDSIDKTTVILLQFFMQAKFYSLFSFLFGWGMAVQLERAAARGTRFVSYYIRRNLILLGIGLIHAFLIWEGDILVVYALLAFLLVLFRNRSLKTILIFSAACLLFSIVMVLPVETMDMVRTWYDQFTSFLRPNSTSSQLYATGSYAEIFQIRKQEVISGLSYFPYWFGNIFSMFLLGLWVGKRGIFKNLDQHQSLLRNVLWVGLIIGLVFNGIVLKTNLDPGWIPAAYRRLAISGARTIGAPALMLFYVSAIILLLKRESWKSRLVHLAPVGKMALSNYLMQSVLCTLIFYGYGLKLYGQISPTVGLILSIFIFLGQMRFSAAWMNRYQFGPVEWVWRSLAYRKFQPIRHGQTSVDPRPGFYRKALAGIKKIPEKLALAGVWVILIAWAVGLVLWNNHLNARGFDNAFTVILKVTATPAGQTDDPGAQPEQTTLSTPVVEAVSYNPGPMAASGDMLSLAAALDVNAAITHIEALASPTYQGRYAGTSGGFAAGNYIAEKFQEYGLQPAGENGTFFQTFPIEINQLSDIPALTVETAQGVLRMAALYRDFSPVTSRYLGDGVANGPIFWADQCDPDTLQKHDLVGKVLFCQGILATEDILSTGRLALEYGAAGLLLLTDPKVRPADFGSRYYLPWVPETIPAFRVYPDIVDEILSGTGYTLDDLQNSLPPMQLESSATLALETLGEATCPSTGCLARNVLGVIPGRNPAYAHEVVLLGGHYDHMGASPDGTIWYGADDNASGIAVLLEIARSWQEQGYVPQRTVVFAAWDAEELGLLGSSYYVHNPSYPLADTVAMLQLDMVGAGAEYLSISGQESFQSQVLSTAEMLGIDAVGSDMGRSDHVPFLMAGVPASLLIWWDESTEYHVHRPNDTPAQINADKFEAAANLANLSLLNLTESEPAILAMLAQREATSQSGDRAAFLATSEMDQIATDTNWFDDLHTLEPVEVDFEAVDLQISGDTAFAKVQIRVEQAGSEEDSGNDSSMRTANLEVQFSREQDGWLWAGPHLESAPTDTNTAAFQVMLPPDAEIPANVGALASDTYATIAAKLGLPAETQADLLLLPSADALRTSIALSLPEGLDSWVAPGEIHLVYDPEIASSELFTTTLAQLVLANTGVPQHAAPWLWEGLPLLLQAEGDPRAVQSSLLPDLAAALEIYPSSVSGSFDTGELSSVPIVSGTTAKQNDGDFSANSWAAADTLLREVGWSGLGTMISKFGESCKMSGCLTDEALEAAYLAAFQKGPREFESAWQDQWEVNLAAVQRDLDTLLVSRMTAALGTDVNAFLLTVDRSVPNLLAAEQSWISYLVNHAPEQLSMVAQPLTIYADGRVLASIRLDVQDNGQMDGYSYPVLIKRADRDPLWMGAPLEILQGDSLDVRYAPGEESFAQAMLTQAETAFAEIAATLEFSPTQKLTVELFNDPDGFRASIFFSYPLNESSAAWTAPGESIKLNLLPASDTADSVDAYSSELAAQISRWMLYQSGVDSEWLLKGVSSLLTRPFDGGKTYQQAGAAYQEVLTMLDNGTLPQLSSLSQDYLLSQSEYSAAHTVALDAVRYLVETYGLDRLIDLLHSYGDRDDLDEAVQAAVGIRLSDFESGWRESLSQGHIAAQWSEIAEAFDQDAASAHIQKLTSAQMSGRQAGTSGDRAAQAYIAEQFAAFGLIPAGNESGTSYFQEFPITTTIMSAAPELEIRADGILDFVFREDFSPTRAISVAINQVSGELVWVQDYHALEFGETLSDTIVVRPATSEIDFEIEQALDHGVVGIILTGSEQGDPVFAKQPESQAYSLQSPIPIFELTQSGTRKLLEATGNINQGFTKLPPVATLGIDGDMAFRLPAADSLSTANVLGLLPGSDPFLKEEVVIIGAHYDHVGDDPSNGLKYSGANDDASGISGLLEIARIWQQAGYQPKRSVLFAAWGAQESGQAGSSYYVENPTGPLENTIGVIQMDGIAGGDGFYPGVQGEWGRDGQLLFRLNTEKDEKWVITPQTTPSDHFAFHDHPIPTLLVSWRLANEDNLPDDFADPVSPEKIEVCVKMVIQMLMGVSG